MLYSFLPQLFAVFGAVLSKQRSLRKQLDDLQGNELGARRVGSKVGTFFAIVPRCVSSNRCKSFLPHSFPLLLPNGTRAPTLRDFRCRPASTTERARRSSSGSSRPRA